MDGADDHVVAEFGHDLSKGPLSVFVWVKGGKPGQAILAQRGAANWLLTDARGALMTELKNGGRLGRPLTSRTIVTDGNWHRIGLVWDGMHRTLYVDDEPIAEDVQNSLQSGYGALHIGGGKDLTPGTFWSGLIDDVRIYSRAVAP